MSTFSSSMLLFVSILVLGVVHADQTKSCTNENDFTGVYENCAHFYRCSNGRYIELECAPGTLFDYRRKLCDYPQNVVCLGIVIKTALRITQKPADNQFQHDDQKTTKQHTSPNHFNYLKFNGVKYDAEFFRKYHHNAHQYHKQKVLKERIKKLKMKNPLESYAMSTTLHAKSSSNPAKASVIVTSKSSATDKFQAIPLVTSYTSKSTTLTSLNSITKAIASSQSIKSSNLSIESPKSGTINKINTTKSKSTSEMTPKSTIASIATANTDQSSTLASLSIAKDTTTSNSIQLTKSDDMPKSYQVVVHPEILLASTEILKSTLSTVPSSKMALNYLSQPEIHTKTGLYSQKDKDVITTVTSQKASSQSTKLTSIAISNSPYFADYVSTESDESSPVIAIINSEANTISQPSLTKIPIIAIETTASSSKNPTTVHKIENPTRLEAPVSTKTVEATTDKTKSTLKPTTVEPILNENRISTEKVKTTVHSGTTQAEKTKFSSTTTATKSTATTELTADQKSLTSTLKPLSTSRITTTTKESQTDKYLPTTTIKRQSASEPSLETITLTTASNSPKLVTTTTTTRKSSTKSPISTQKVVSTNKKAAIVTIKAKAATLTTKKHLNTKKTANRLPAIKSQAVHKSNISPGLKGKPSKPTKLIHSKLTTKSAAKKIITGKSSTAKSPVISGQKVKPSAKTTKKTLSKVYKKNLLPNDQIYEYESKDFPSPQKIVNKAPKDERISRTSPIITEFVDQLVEDSHQNATNEIESPQPSKIISVNTHYKNKNNKTTRQDQMQQKQANELDTSSDESISDAIFKGIKAVLFNAAPSSHATSTLRHVNLYLFSFGLVLALGLLF